MSNEVRRLVKRPPVFEAMQWDGTVEGAWDLGVWINRPVTVGKLEGDGELKCYVKTLRDSDGNDVYYLRSGDWIMRGFLDEFKQFTSLEEIERVYEVVERKEAE